MKLKKIPSVIGALLIAVLVCLTLFSSALQCAARDCLVIGIAVAMGCLGITLFPNTPSKRPIVKRELLLGASLSLLASAAALVGSVLGFSHVFAFAFSHPFASGLGLAAGAGVVLTQEQVEEFQSVLRGLVPYGETLRELPNKLAALARENSDLRVEINKLRKAGLNGYSGGVRWIGEKPFVSDDCAKALTSVFVVGLARIDGGLERFVGDSGSRERVLMEACQTLGLETKAAMTGTEIPLPTVYVPQIVELVWKYGQARQFATVLPLGAGTVKLPRLKAGEDEFGYFGAGTAGMSQSITEKKVATELVTFTANKGGGLIRLPTELEADTFIPIGQFLARYVARQFAKMEDKTLFLADGSPTYASQTGIGPYCAANPTYLLQLGAGKTKPSDATLADFRNLRSKVSGALLGGGFDPAYYMSSTFEPFLRSFNTYPNFIVYENMNGQPKFDGFPIRWIGVSQTYSTAAAAGTYIAFFGDLSYWYLGERGQPRVEVSRDVFFATDELAMRALERIDVEAMAVDAMAALETAAA